MEELDLYFEGKTLKDTDLISKCNIGRNSTLHISFRLRGGVVGRGATSSSKPSFREVVDKRSSPVQLAEPKPTEYMVEKSKQSPCVEMADLEIKGIYLAYPVRAIIYRINGYWPKTNHLYQWVHTNWATKCEILLCAKGFFIVYFVNPTDYKQVLESRPWFWGRVGCFITPWTSYFDPVHASVTITPA